jgi:hypothetical protein
MAGWAGMPIGLVMTDEKGNSSKICQNAFHKLG